MIAASTHDSSCRYCGVHESDMDDLGLVWTLPDACSWCYNELQLADPLNRVCS